MRIFKDIRPPMSIVCKMTVLQSRAEVPRPKPKPASISNLQNKLQITYKLLNIFCQLSNDKNINMKTVLHTDDV